MNASLTPAPPITAPSRVALGAHYTLATWFGCGFSPLAPGTVGSLGAVPLVWLLTLCDNVLLSFAVLVVLSVGGARAAHVVALHRGDEDPGLVVIDEVVGVVVAWLCVAHAPLIFQALAWVLFRVFDITKPGPIRTLEHTRPIGVGIMLDDLLAGLVAGGLAWLAAFGFGALA